MLSELDKRKYYMNGTRDDTSNGNGRAKPRKVECSLHPVVRDGAVVVSQTNIRFVFLFQTQVKLPFLFVIGGCLILVGGLSLGYRNILFDKDPRPDHSDQNDKGFAVVELFT